MITRAILCVLLFLPRQVPLFVLSPDSPITVGKAPTAVATADFNRDGNLDIVVANSGSNNLTVLMGNGKGSFRLASGSPVPAGRKPHHVTAADWNGDGNMDLATAPHDGGSDVTLFLGNGRGGFAREPGSPISSVAVSEPHTHAVIAANANRDDHPDLLVVNAGTNRDKPALSLSVLLNDGKARFRHGPGSPVPLPGILASVATGDFNRDGSLDLAATLEGRSKDGSDARRWEGRFLRLDHGLPRRRPQRCLGRRKRGWPRRPGCHSRKRRCSAFWQCSRRVSRCAQHQNQAGTRMLQHPRCRLEPRRPSGYRRGHPRSGDRGAQ